MGKNDEIREPPGLEDISELFHPSAPASPSPVANVSMKLPVIWPDAAEVWFDQVKTQFGIRNVSVSKTKFDHAVAVLPQEVASQILHLRYWISSGLLQLAILRKFSESVS